MGPIPLTPYRTLQAVVYAVGALAGVWYLLAYRHHRGNPLVRDLVGLVAAAWVAQLWSLWTRWHRGPAPLPSLPEQLMLLAGITTVTGAVVLRLRQHLAEVRRGGELCPCCQGRGVRPPDPADPGG